MSVQEITEEELVNLPSKSMCNDVAFLQKAKLEMESHFETILGPI